MEEEPTQTNAEPMDKPTPPPQDISRLSIETITEYNEVQRIGADGVIGVDRMPVKKLKITVAPGEPVVLQGLVDGQWKDVAIISSNGGTIKGPLGKYLKYRFDTDTNKRMTFEPPKVTAIGPKKNKPKIIRGGS